MGVIATRDIKAGELILKEKPFVVWADEEDVDDLERAVQALTDTEKKSYYAHHIAGPYKQLPPTLGIFKTNGLPLEHGALGFFDQGSRFNHSCLPNCSNHWDEGQEVRWSIANREIRKGEEIQISYGRTRAPKSERQGWLEASFGFICGCKACSYEEDRTRESDRRRITIQEIYDSVEELSASPLLVIGAVNLALRLLEEEDLAAGALDLAHEALNVCVWFGDRLNSSRWIDKTLEIRARENGVWSTKHKDIEVWKSDPTCHPGWEDLCRKLKVPPMVLIGPE